jgi:hypothetical protein
MEKVCMEIFKSFLLVIQFFKIILLFEGLFTKIKILQGILENEMS